MNALRALGHDVLWAGADYEGNSDEDLLAVASRDRRLVLTLDKDFGELAFNQKLPVLYGIILLRFHAAGARLVTDRLVEVLQTRDDW